jgi:hypothetical protein
MIACHQPKAGRKTCQTGPPTFLTVPGEQLPIHSPHLFLSHGRHLKIAVQAYTKHFSSQFFKRLSASQSKLFDTHEKNFHLYRQCSSLLSPQQMIMTHTEHDQLQPSIFPTGTYAFLYIQLSQLYFYARVNMTTSNILWEHMVLAAPPPHTHSTSHKPCF